MAKKRISEEKEKIPLLAIYRHDGKLHLRINKREAQIFEIYGFLEIYLNNLRVELEDMMEHDKDDSD
jgi:hypothetical protein